MVSSILGRPWSLLPGSLVNSLCVQRAHWTSDQVVWKNYLVVPQYIPAIVIREGRVRFRSPWFWFSFVVCRITEC